MLAAKTFHVKTKRGSIIKIVREHYLRDDIPCGREDCGKCDGEGLLSPGTCILSKKPRLNITSLCSGSHYIIPDTNLILHQLDILEDPSFGNNFILLQTVKNEVRHKSLAIYSKLKALEESKRCYVFYNEFHKDTYQKRLPGETPNDYNDRLIRIAAGWFSSHVGNQINIIILTNDAENKKKALDMNMNCHTLSDYVKSMKNNVNLLDKLADLGSNENEEKGGNLKELKFVYPEHISLSTMQTGIKKGTLHQGKFASNRDNYLEGFVSITLNGEDVMVLIQGREFINRAVHDDIVCIELLPKDQWKSKSDVILLPEEEADQENKKTALNSIDVEKSSRPTGKVIGIIKRNWRQYCGTLKEKNSALSKSIVFTQHLFIPAERRIPIIRIETRQYETLQNQRIIVAIDSWPKDSKYPKGHYVRALGEIGDKETENEVLLLEHDVPHFKFTPAVMNCLPTDPNNWTIPEAEIEKRKDLRNTFICSVDPPGCTDIDDALHCKELDNDLVEVGVHIADVSYFVKPNTALDNEARNRGTTVYLVDRRIDMIPTVLSSNLCSLIANKDRLTFSVIWTLDKSTAKIKKTEFFKTVIRSKAALTYAEAQLRIDSEELNDKLTISLRNLNKLAKILKNNRLRKGALVLANAGEIRFVDIESETHDNVTEIESKQIKETNSMVEEFMLLANISVAQKLYDEFPELALLRRHPKPSPANFEELVNAGKSRGFEIEVDTGKNLSRSLDLANDPSNQYINLMLRMIATRCMTQALYFCSGALSNSENNFQHFGLAAKIYTHFTSPIRRYADLIVHRLLSHFVGASNLDPNLLGREQIQRICDNINYRHRKAQFANRASVNLNTLIYIKKSTKKLVEEGYIMFAKQNALQIFVPRLALEVTYFLNPITDWKFSDTKDCQTHLGTGIELRQFDKITIQLGIVDKSSDFKRGFEKVDVQIVNPVLTENKSVHPTKKQKI